MLSDDEKLEMVKCFVTESRELLDDVEPQIIAMEQGAVSCGKVDEEILNAIFRLFHSLKGSASFLDLQTIIRVTHEAETLLDIFRSGQAVLEPEHVDLLIRTSDLIRNILDGVEQQLNDEGFESAAEIIIDDLKKTIAAITGRSLPSNSGETDSEKNNSEGTGSEETETNMLFDNEKVVGKAGNSILPENPEDMDFVINGELKGRFVEESFELLDNAEKAVLALEKAPDDMESAGRAFRYMHSFKGNAGFLGYGELEEVSHHAEALLDRIREGAIVCDAVAVSFLLIAIDILRDGVRQIDNNMVPELSGKQEICMYLQNMAGGLDRNPGREGQEAGSDCSEEPGDFASQQKEECVGEGFEEGNKQEVTANINNAATGAKPEPFVGDKKIRHQQVIRVDLEKLDKLLDLVGELVISEAMVANSPDLKGLQLDRFEKSVLQLEKITRDIQEVAMSMRMIPLQGTFNKMVRLVRNLSHKVNKKVSLEIAGEDTEVDKTIIEQISDPLVHLIRNAVDHGIESPEERIAAGKPESGRLKIKAKHSAGEVWISVEDDGRGLDREKILQKGREKGLINDDGHNLKDEEVWRLIFEPGFSTADKVSSISGRGVGMDVVKRNIEKLRGRIDIRSEKGAGTVFSLRIPLTLAIIEGMVIKVGQNRYIIPISSIRESLRPSVNQITRMPDKLELVSIRGELLPVIRLNELFNIASGCRSLESGILVVVESGAKKCCLFVDEVLGQQQVVIKGLSSYLGRVKSVSGCAILGDGDISMILDIDDLINSAEVANID